MHAKIPLPVLNILETLQKADFEAYIVGGCVRDLILNRSPKDWDITTNAVPEAILKLFPDSFYENEFGTVGVKVPRFLKATSLEYDTDVIEVTTYRTESDYNDKRHPQTIRFSTSLHEDLARRDFTMNALAYGKDRSGQWTLVDLFEGQKHITEKVICAVGNPAERFREDALRLMRAVRFQAELRQPESNILKYDWHIDSASFEAIQLLADNIKHVSQERIRDEFSRILLSASPAHGIQTLHDTGLLRTIMPELELGIGVTQNLHHIYTVWEHNLRALATCPSEKLSVRLACLLHDIGKPHTKRGEGYHATFYNHDHVGARLTRDILTRLRYPKEIVTHATLLVDNHLFYYNVGEVTEASVRRLIKRVGLENMDDLMAVRIGDRLGSGVPKGKPYKLRHLEYMIEKVSRDPISVKMLAIRGDDLMKELSLPASPKIGALLEVLLGFVIDDPKENTRESLIKKAEALAHHDLGQLRKLASEKIAESRQEADAAIKKRYWVE